MRYASYIYMIGAVATVGMLIYGSYESGGFHREHTARQLAIIAGFYFAAAALWPTLLVIVPLKYFGALPQVWDITIAKVVLLVLLLVAMATGIWASSRILNRAPQSGRSYQFYNLTSVVSLRQSEPLIFALALLVGIVSITGLIALN